jgi:uncharacterized protein (TIGR01777 family)
MNITLTGATGFIGSHLVKALLARGHQLTILSRTARPGENPRYLEWDARYLPPAEALHAGAVIHLAGESVAQRWTAEAKQRIRSSRIDATRMLVNGFAQAPNKPEVLISASAIGIYGPRGDEILTESSPVGSGFLEDLSAAWEMEAQRAAELGIRVVNPRFGIVLGRDGGALEKMLPPFKAGAGGRLGSGEQWMSWIHVDDAVGLLLFALEHGTVNGPMNFTAPCPRKNADFTRDLGGVLKRPAVIPAPMFALKLLFGEMASVLVASQRVVPQTATKAGYDFRYPKLRPALEQILSG